MTKSALKLTTLAMAAFACVSVVEADTLNNGFDNQFDYVANGIVGDTNWDGIYMRFGDVFGGSAGGSGGGNTVVANTTVFGGGFLGIQTTGTDWSGADNDGFFLYKVVSGDFDVSIQNVPGTLGGGVGYDNRAFNLAGLMMRAYSPSNNGAPYATTVTNAAENNVRLWRFNEFNIDGQVRISTNGVNVELNHPGSNSETNSARFYRITRVGNVFTFYVRTNSFDPWFQVTNGLAAGTLTRNDWNGVALQVGIAQASFNTAARDVLFDDFSITGAGVTFPAMPTAPSGLVTTATNTGGSLTFQWTKGTPANNSLVVISRRPIQHNPIQGITYNASSVYGDTNALLGGGGEFAVYNGSGNSVTVTNLGANNLTYYVAVYEHTGTGASTVYNTASPATNAFSGPGIITGAIIVAPTTNIPIDGAVALQLLATFSTGETSDQSPSATWVSGNTAVANVNLSGTVSGLSVGSSLITATFGSFNPSVTINVGAPTIVDSFSATQDFVANGLLGSTWDGLYLNFGDVPGAVPGGDGNGQTTVMNSQITSTNGLSISSFQSDWQGTANDGPYLFRIVPGNSTAVSGDFSAMVDITAMNTLANSSVGLMARLFNPANHGAGPNNAEYHVNYWKVQNGFTAVRRTQNGGNATLMATGPAAANNSLLMQRINSTNFYFFERSNVSNLWTFATNIVLAAASNNAPMEVGIAQETRSGVTANATVSRFMITAAGLTSGTPPPPAATGFNMVLNLDLSMTLNWVAADGLGNPVQSIVVMRANAPVTAQPSLGANVVGNSVFGTAGTSLGGGNFVVFVSSPTPADTNNTVTVTGLAPGVTYYAAVYTFVGSGTSKVFNNVIPPTGASGSLADGVLQGIVSSLEGGVPQGGIGQLRVLAIYTGGAAVDVSSSAVVTSADTNVIKVLSGVLTGVTNGSAAITATFGGFTNVANVVVRPPAFSDNFNVARNYLASGAAGSGWDGLYDPNATTNPIPGSAYVPLTFSGATVADANITTNNALTITSAGDGWENNAAGGFFLYKYIYGDFQMSVHIQSFEIAAFNQPGLLARAYGLDTNGVIGAPFGTVVTNVNGTNDLAEYWVSLCRFDEFGIGTYARRNIDGVVSQNTQPDPTDTNYWLLIIRSQGTNFNFYKRLNPTDPWRRLPNNTSYQIPQFAGHAMQVGLMAGPWTGNGGLTRTVVFENFQLDYPSGPTLRYSRSGGNITLSWPIIPGAVLQASPTLNPATWVNVPGTPTLSASGYSLTVSAGSNYEFFRLKLP
jgi:hypothetical protein